MMRLQAIHLVCAGVLFFAGANGRKVNGYTPPGYDKDKKYPVLYALHEIGGDQKEWMSSKPQEILDNLFAADKIVPMIVVFPNGRAMNPDKCPREMYGSANVQGFNDFWEKDMRDFLVPFGLVSRHDDIHVETMSFGESAPTKRDAIFRIALRSKLITVVAAMILVNANCGSTTPSSTGCRSWQIAAY